MYAHILLALFVFCVVGSHGFFSSAGSRGSQPAICRLPSKPCRLQFTLNYLNGTLDTELNTQTCTCSAPNRCSTDWSRANYVISRNMLSTTHNVTMNMMFCQPVQPQTYCVMGETALVVSGSLTIPYDVVSFNCRCDDATPLLLSERTYGSDYLIYHSYVCNSHMPTCPRRNSVCATIRRDEINYSCKCPSSSTCQVPQGHSAHVGNAYCRP